MVSVVDIRRGRLLYSGVFDVTSPGGTLSVGSGDVMVGGLRNYLRRAPTAGTLDFLRVTLTKMSPVGGALGAPIVAATPVGSATSIDITFDDPGLGVTERWQVRIVYPHSLPG